MLGKLRVLGGSEWEEVEGETESSSVSLVLRDHVKKRKKEGSACLKRL